MFVYKLCDDYNDDMDIVLLANEEEYSYDALNKLVNDLLFDDDGELRNVFSIADLLVDDYGFEYVVPDVTLELWITKTFIYYEVYIIN